MIRPCSRSISSILPGCRRHFLTMRFSGNHRQHAGFGCTDDQIVVRHDVARRAQAVAVERRPDLPAIGEDHRSRAVPRLHHRGVVFVERAPPHVHRRVLLPGLGDHHHRGMGERVAAHHQQFERVVEGRGIGLVLEADRVKLGQVVAQHRRLHHPFAGAHPVEVALDGVDLAVVRDHAVRVRERPLREGIGREALMDERQGRDHARILQIFVVLADLIGQQQALVDDRAAAHAGHVVLAAVRELELLDRRRRGLADHVELALEGIRHDHVRTAADEDLLQHRLLQPHRRRHRHFGVHRHIAPADQQLPFGPDRALQFLFAGKPRGMFLRQEDLADAVFAERRQLDALPGHLGAVEVVRNLDQDAGAVAHQLVGADRAAMVEVLEDLQTLQDDAVRLVALDVGDEADAAGIVFLTRAVETVGSRHVAFRWEG